MVFSKKGELAITPVTASKIEIDPGTGFARAKNRTQVVMANLVFSYEYNNRIYKGGSAKVILKGSAPLAAWAKQVYEFSETPGITDSQSFVLCPESEVIGFIE